MKYSIFTFLALSFSLVASADMGNQNMEAEPTAVRTEAPTDDSIGEVIVSGEVEVAAVVTPTEQEVTTQVQQQAQQAQQTQNTVDITDFPPLVHRCASVLLKINQKGASETGESTAPDCLAVDYVTKNITEQSIHARAYYQTSDNAVTCVQKTGYTLDFESCKRTAKVYNTLVASAVALEIQAEVRARNAQAEIAEDAQKKALAGDFQGAGLQASKDNSSTMKQIHRERAAAYGAAVAALGAALGTWVSDADDACEDVDKFDDCKESVKLILKDGADAVFPNESSKGVFSQALMQYTAKAIEAGIESNKHKSNEEAVAKIQSKYEEDIQGVQFDECTINPSAKKCLGPGQRIAGESISFGSGDFAIGGGNSNAFDFGPGGVEEFNEFGDEANVESQKVAAINSPFVDEAKEANDILDRASAASGGSGANGGGPGGGPGGAGMSGGGSASLGNDTKTPDETPEEAEIKAKKSSGSYASAGGGKGFTGVKSSKEDSNPFASLFDQKGSAGGIVEDRSIASKDIDDKSSVLFQKISRKYTEMHSNKRIEANNLD